MRKLAMFAFSFSGAVMFSQYLLTSGWQFAFIAVFFCVFAAGFLLKGNKRLAVTIIAFAAAFGFGWNCFYTAVFFEPALELDGVYAHVLAEVTDFPKSTDYGMNADMNVHLENGRTVKTIVYFYNDTAKDLKPGDSVTLTADFSRADMIHDIYTGTLTSKGYYLTAKGAEITEVIHSDGVPMKYVHRYIAKALKNVISNIFPESTEGFMQALLTGDRILINEDEELTGAMQRTGVYHVIAVSGLQVSVLTGFVYLVFGRRRSVLLLIVPILILFMGVSGFTPSVVRAVVMQMFLLAAPIFKREGDSLTSLSAALFLILIVDPFAAESVGLQLSFAAMLGIILISPRMYDYFTKRKKPFFRRNKFGRKIFSMFFGGLATSAGAIVFTMPLTALYFGYVSLIAPVVNLIILWAVSAAFCAGLAAIAAGAVFVPAGFVLAWLASVPVWFIMWTVKGMSKLFFAAVYLDTLAAVVWFIFVYLMIFIFAVGRVRPRFMIMPACASVISLAAIMIVTSEVNSARSGLSATVLDVGQGQSIVVTSGEYTAVIDCGSSSEDNAGENAYRYLSGIGRTNVDIFVLTHFHDDHANGATELLNYIDVDVLAVPVPDDEEVGLSDEIIDVAKRRGTEVIYVQEDVVAELGTMILTLYAPIGSMSENERCVCVLASEDDFDFLVTGDISSSIERVLIDHADFPDIEAMVVGHHGSKYSTSDELLTAVKPEAAVISVGTNSYGHPSDETLGRIMSHGVEIYRTDEYGNIKIEQEK